MLHSSASVDQPSPVDRALALVLEEQHEAALRWLVSQLEAEPGQLAALYVAGRALFALGQRDDSARAFRLACDLALDAGNLPFALAACAELRHHQENPDAELDAIAEAFCQGSPRLLARPRPPPDLPGQATKVTPLSDTLSGAALLARAAAAVSAVRTGHQQKIGGDSSKLSPQPLFSALPKAALRAMLGVFDVMAVPAQSVVIKEGTAGAEAFVAVRGELEVKRAQGETEIVLARLGSGALFGEMALLSRAPRAASVVTCRPSILLVARAEDLDEVAAQKPEVGRVLSDHCRRRMVENVVRTSPLLGAVAPAERPRLLERFETRTFEQEDRLIHQDRKAEGLHLIASGEVQVVTNEPDGRTALTRLGPGEVVGEVALVLRRTANADVVARYPTVTLYLREERFLETIHAYPGLLLALYELAVKRELETSSIVAQEAADIDDHVLL